MIVLSKHDTAQKDYCRCIGCNKENNNRWWICSFWEVLRSAGSCWPTRRTAAGPGCYLALGMVAASSKQVGTGGWGYRTSRKVGPLLRAILGNGRLLRGTCHPLVLPRTVGGRYLVPPTSCRGAGMRTGNGIELCQDLPQEYGLCCQRLAEPKFGTEGFAVRNAVRHGR